jgi:hypothetical protein
MQTNKTAKMITNATAEIATAIVTISLSLFSELFILLFSVVEKLPVVGPANS